jgi:hypothetical protein
MAAIPIGNTVIKKSSIVKAESNISLLIMIRFGPVNNLYKVPVRYRLYFYILPLYITIFLTLKKIPGKKYFARLTKNCLFFCVLV